MQPLLPLRPVSASRQESRDSQHTVASDQLVLEDSFDDAGVVDEPAFEFLITFSSVRHLLATIRRKATKGEEKD